MSDHDVSSLYIGVLIAYSFARLWSNGMNFIYAGRRKAHIPLFLPLRPVYRLGCMSFLRLRKTVPSQFSRYLDRVSCLT